MRGEIAMRSPGGKRRPGIESELLDLSAMPLSELRELDSAALHRSVRRAVERTAYIPITASGSGGAQRVE
jgi:hypothetical protein